MIDIKNQHKLFYHILMLALMGLGTLFFCPIAQADTEGREAYYAELGDTIEKIAFLNGLDENLVAAMNNVGITDRLRENQRIWLPLEPIAVTAEPTTVTVMAGDTLWQIARSYDTTVAALCELNNISRPDRLKIGQTVTLPAAATEEASLGAGEARMVLARVEAASRSSKLTWPVKGSISSYYGWRSRGWHCGLDIAANTGSAVTASAPGIVVQAGWRSDAYGYAVMLDHGNGMQTLYAHNSQVVVEKGQFIRQGQVIAEVGETGNATGPHVHLEVRLNDICQDPLEYLR